MTHCVDCKIALTLDERRYYHWRCEKCERVLWGQLTGEPSKSDWRPIGTAPKDARILLLTGRQEVAVGKWLDNSATSHPWSGWSTDLGPSARATHWMPLPLPPSNQITPTVDQGTEA